MAIEKKEYEQPEVTKVEFDFSERITASEEAGTTKEWGSCGGGFKN